MPHLNDVNLLAVAGGTIAIMAIGFLWYGPLFGKAFIKLAGLNPEDLKGGPGMAPLFGLINAFVTAFLLGFFLHWLNVSGVHASLLAAFLLWLGFMATTQALPWIWAKQPIKLTLLHMGNQLAGILAAALVLSLF